MTSNDKVLVDLGNQIRGIREDARLTQAEVAKAAGVNASYFAEIERGEVNPSYKVVRAILLALKVNSLDVS
ncbi:MAG: anaerobic benzoate catabolism transcriptional regulator [bacterium ADurb.Bin400]|nr:MAG: anaerobic benzoate catabolism transcriptional regulator [bacterium ADurb.Bin400]